MSDLNNIILPNSKYDFSYRKIKSSDLTRFKGLEGQIVNIKDDSFRPAIYQGAVGDYKTLMFQSDLKSEETVQYLRELQLSDLYTEVDATENNYSLNTDKYSIFKINLYKPTNLSLVNTETGRSTAKVVTLLVNNVDANSKPIFTNDITWIGSEPEFPDSVRTYLIRLYGSSTSWIGELVTSTGSAITSNTGVPYTDATNPSGSEWIQPLDGSSTVKQFFLDINDEDKQYMSNVSQNIDDIKKLSTALHTLSAIEDNLEVLSSVNANTLAIQTIANSINKLNTLVESLGTILDIQKYISNINLVAHHIKDKDFLDVKVTDSLITGVTILPLDKIVLAPSVYPSSAGSSGGIIDTDSSDGSISPTLLIWSDHDIADSEVGDGTIIVSPTRNKINSVNKQ